MENNSMPKKLPSMGREMRKKFLLDPNFIQMNHGSYGTYPRVVQTSLHTLQERSERNAELWFRRDSKIELQVVREKLANLMVAPHADDIVLIQNTTAGVNGVLRSLVFKPGDRILYFSTVYGAVREAIRHICDYSQGNANHIEFKVTYPLTDDDLVQNFQAFVDQHHSTDPSASTRIRLAIIDHISSNPGVIVPIARLILILKSKNIWTFVDGAHAIGQVPINLTKLAPDFYVTNCHKWLYAARGCAIMYVNKIHQHWVHPAIISQHYQQPSSRFQDEFYWIGTLDYSSYLTVNAALAFRKDVGGEEVIRGYNHNLAVNGGKLVAERFGTKVLESESQIGSMVDVMLPLNDHNNPKLSEEFWIEIQLNRFESFAPAYKHGGYWWIRLSAQIYNDLSDFESTASAFLEICNELNTSM